MFNMEKLDETIEYIEDKIKDGQDSPEMITALSSLVQARTVARSLEESDNQSANSSESACLSADFR